MPTEYKTRIQLKSDTEENWNKVGPKPGSSGFIPLQGELIIYIPDDEHPDYSRLKIGDGSTNVVNLPFIDAGTINDKEVEIVKLTNFASRPSPGSPDKLYVDMSTNVIYHYDGTSGYTQLSNFVYETTTVSVAKFNSWDPGNAATASISNNVFKITNGTAPVLSYENATAITSIKKKNTNNI